MRYVVSSALAAAALAVIAASPAPLSAGLFGFGECHHCQHRCQRCQVNPCACSAPAPQVTVQPQVQMVPQTMSVPQVSYRDVTRTEYRTEAQTQTVPVTTYQTVTVDEGSWQQVWVPRVVQKQVPQVTYQQQISYRQVPYQVTQRVPQVSYQTQTTMVPRVTSVAQSTCNVCGPTGIAAAPIYSAPPMATVPPPVAMPQMVAPQYAAQQQVVPGPELQPLASLSGVSSHSSTASTSGVLTPVPDPKYLDTPQAASSDRWEPVRTAAAPTQMTPVPAYEPQVPRTGSASGLFVPAPAAADIWRTRIR
ncbi:hypothetical protein GC176_04380 [bacterium]|nr:hypothetical protein [bacterium]